MRVRPLRVLVVDDYAGFRRAAHDLLHMRGFQVVGEAPDGKTAHELVAKLAPDAVLLDIELSGESGFDVARTLTKAHPGVAVLLVSAGRDSVPAAELRKCGARGYLAKWKLAEVDLGELWQQLRRTPGIA